MHLLKCLLWSTLVFYISAKSDINLHRINIFNTDVEYIRAVFEPNSDYDMVMLFTAPAQICPFCAEIETAFSKVAALHTEFQKSMKGEVKNIVFGQLDLAVHKKVGILHGLEGVPSLVVVPRSWSGKFESKKQHTFPERNFAPLAELGKQRRDHEPNVFLNNWINGAFHRQVQIQLTFGEKMTKGINFTLLFILCLVGVYYALQSFRTYPWTMGILYLAIYFLATCGLINVIIHGAPLYGVDKETGLMKFFHEGRRSQYMIEGMITAGAVTLSAAGFFLIGSASRVPFLNKGNINIFVVVVFIFGFFAWNWVHHMFTLKMNFPQTSFMPPADFIKGPLRNDRHVSF